MPHLIDRYELPPDLLQFLIGITDAILQDIIKECDLPENVALLLVAGILNKYAWGIHVRAKAAENENKPPETKH